MADSDDATVPEDGPETTAPETLADDSSTEDSSEAWEESGVGEDAGKVSGDLAPPAKEVEDEADTAPEVDDLPDPNPEPVDDPESAQPETTSRVAASSPSDDASPAGERENSGSSSVVAESPDPPTFPKEETMANTPSSGTCGALHNPGNSNPSSLTLTGHKPYLVITYSKGGKDPLHLTFDNDAKMVLCPGSSACYDMKGVDEVVIHYTGVAKFTWCWTDEATSCCQESS